MRHLSSSGVMPLTKKSHLRDGVLHSVGVVEPVLDVEVDDHLGDPHDLPEQVEGVPEPRVFPLSGGQSLHWLQVLKSEDDDNEDDDNVD